MIGTPILHCVSRYLTVLVQSCVLTWTLSVHAHDVRTGAHWNGFTQDTLGGILVTVTHRKEKKQTKIKHDFTYVALTL